MPPLLPRRLSCETSSNKSELFYQYVLTYTESNEIRPTSLIEILATKRSVGLI